MQDRTSAPTRAQARRAARKARPAPIAPASPRLAGATTHRPRRLADHAPHRDANYGVLLLHGLGALDRHVYGGTVPRVVVADRRVRNRAARAARAITQRRAR